MMASRIKATVARRSRPSANPMAGDRVSRGHRAIVSACERLEGRRLLSVAVTNPSFETPALPSSPGYVYDPSATTKGGTAGATWAFTGNAGIQQYGSAFDTTVPAPDGTQTAFLQSSGAGNKNLVGSVSQSLTFSTVGTYAVTFQAALRYASTTNVTKPVLPIEVLVDGVQVGGAISPTSTAFASFTSASFTIGSTGSHAITFTGVDNTTVDEDVFIDLVSVGTAIAPPTVTTPAAATPSTVAGTTSALRALGASAAGESTLTYTWSTTGTPPAAVAFSANGTNAAKNATATFTAAGTYNLLVTIADANGSTVTSAVTVTVNQTLTSVAVTPTAASVYTGNALQFAATALDQFGNALATQPTITWSRTGVGSISSAGLFTAGSTTGSATVKASTGGINGNTVAVSVIAAGTPSITTPAAANPSAVTGKTTTLTVSATDGNGGADLTYAWSLTGTVPAAVAYSANGTAAASTTTATFAAAGTYNFRVTVTSTTGQSTTSSVSVVVSQTATSIAVTPGSASIAASGTQQFTATEYDQFGTAMSPQPTFAWSAASGAGTAGSTAIGSVASATGLYTASSTPGTGTVSASAGGLFGTAQVNVGGATIAGGTVTLATFGSNAYYAVDTNSCAIAVDNMWTDAASGYQFAGFYTTGGEIMIARRTSGSASWQAYDSGINDSTYTSDDHDVISIAVDSAGYMHMSWGMHNIPLNYAISNVAVTGPALASLSFTLQTSTTAPTLFALAANDTGGLTSDTNEVTYPQFYAIPNSTKLLFAYRNGGAGGGSGNGDEYINVYTPATRTWTHTLFIDGEHTSVNAYLNRLTYDSNNNLIATWTWRSSPNFQTNSNIMYAQSPDNGTTWYTQGGTGQYTLPIIQTDGTNSTYSSADTSVAQVVVTIPQGSSLINQASMTVDNNNNPIVSSYDAPATASKNYNLQYMVWYSVNGVWHSSQVTNRTSDTAYDSGGTYVRDLGRPDVLVDKQGRVLVVTRSEDTAQGAYSSATTPNNNIVVYFTTTAALDAGTPNWQSVALNTTNMGDYEPTYDQNLWASSNVLSMFFEPIARSDQNSSNVPVVQSLDWNEQAYFNSAPTVATAAAATPSPVTGTSTTLSVLGADNNGESNLTYTWSTTGTVPAGVTYTANGTNAAKATTAQFAAAGTYHFVVTIANAYGYSTTSAVTVTVAQTVTSVTVSPATASVGQAQQKQFSAVAYDQFGAALATQPTFAWSTTGTGNTVSSAGLFTAGSSVTGPATVTATAGTIGGTATVTVVAVSTLTLANTGLAYLELTADGLSLQVWPTNTPGPTPPSQTLLLSSLNGVNVPAGTTLVVDASNGSIPATVPLTFTAGSGTTTVTGVGTSSLLAAVVPAGASVAFVGTQAAGTLSVAAGDRVTVANTASGAHAVLVVGSLSLAATATLNLAGTDLVVTQGTLAAVTAAAKTGYANGAWTGPGLDSSTAAADATHLTAVGIAVATTATTLDGIAVPAGAVMAKVTAYGDANLDGVVNVADYTRIDAGFISGGTGWANGDFNYDGVVDGSDYTLIDNAFNMQATPPASAVAPATSVLAAPAALVAQQSAVAPSAPAPTPPSSVETAAAAMTSDDLHKRRHHPADPPARAQAESATYVRARPHAPRATA
jgi:hypothetical protein